MASPETAPQLMTSNDALRSACARWQTRPALAIDTEFVRTRTFVPHLGLIQVSDGEQVTLVDPLATQDLSPFLEILWEPSVVKVFHSCGEDLEVLYHLSGDFPRPLFDTQLAAALTGHGHSLGYARLVQELYEVELDKGETRTDWLKRPLSEAQKRYAAQDVAYLLPAWEQLARELREAGRETWLDEEIQRLFDAERFLPEPDTFYLRIKRSRNMSRRQLAVLKELAAWREREARRLDRPRNFLVKEPALIQLALEQPKSRQELQQLEILHPQELRRHGDTLLGIVRAAGLIPADERPPAPEPHFDTRPYRKLIDRLRARASASAEEHGVPIELLATKRDVEQLVRDATRPHGRSESRLLEGWRQQVAGADLLELAGDALA